MGMAQDGLDMWKKDRRRNVTQWFRKHGAVAAATVTAQRVGRRSWEGAFRTATNAGAAIREQVDGMRRRRHSEAEPIADGGQARDDAARAARSTGSPAGQSLALAAAVLIEEADAEKGASETVITLEGLQVGFEVYTEAVQFFAEKVRDRKGDKSAVKAVDDLSQAVADLADETQRVLKLVASLYAPQMEQEDMTGEAMK